MRKNNAELTALGKAKAFLLIKLASVLTTAKAHALSNVQARDGADSKSRTLRSIEQLGRNIHGIALVSFAGRAASDPFGKIPSVTEDVIARLLQDAAGEAINKANRYTEIADATKTNDGSRGDGQGQCAA